MGSSLDFLLFMDRPLDDSADLTLNGDFVPDMLVSRISSSFPESKIVYGVPDSYSGTLRDSSIIHKGKDDTSFWKEAFKQSEAPHIARIAIDAPFFDTTTTTEMFDIHTEWRAEYTYGENLPEGFACDIISRDLISIIPETKDESLPLGQVIRSNINQFDVELYYRSPDMRKLRMNFLSSSPRDRAIMEKLHTLHGGIPSYEETNNLIQSHPEVLYLAPSYVEIELTGHCGLNCSYCYRSSLTETHPPMEESTLTAILEGVREFNLPYTVALGGSGEPMEHPSFYSSLEMILKEPLVERVIIETNGQRTDDNYRQFLSSSPRGDRIITIINLSANNAETYRNLQGGDDYQQLHDNILALNELQKEGPERHYIQILKTNDTEPFLDSFYDYWEGHKVPIILQKQNVWLGRVEDRRYSDLSPVERFPCWHLQRDLFILSTGDVAFCRQDVAGEKSLGNVKNMPIMDIWKAGEARFLAEYRGEHAAVPDCANCDEWYTFNF